MVLQYTPGYLKIANDRNVITCYNHLIVIV